MKIELIYCDDLKKNIISFLITIYNVTFDLASIPYKKYNFILTF